MQQLKPINSTRGFSLVEVLVTILMLSLGLLGIASMQLKALEYNQGAYLRSQAVVLGYDILDRMRANKSGITSSSYDGINTNTITTGSDCEAASCTSANMASYDAHQWKLNIESLLPSGVGITSQNGNIMTITIMWDEQRTGTAPGSATCSDFKCFVVTAQIQ